VITFLNVGSMAESCERFSNVHSWIVLYNCAWREFIVGRGGEGGESTYCSGECVKGASRERGESEVKEE